MATIEEAREYARSLKLKDQKGWQKYVKENDIPEGMSTYPDKTYKDKGWKGWGDFLGTRNISTHKFKKLPFDEVREFAHSLGLKNREEWVKYVNEPKNILREGIPRYPNGVYENEGWKGWGDFLGTETRAPQDFEPLPFEEVKKIVHSWELKDRNEFRSYAKKEGLPDGIPANPSRTYEGKGWKGWGDFLGTGRQLYRRFQSLPFEEAKKIVHSFGLGGQEEYRRYIKENRPDGIPRYPDDTYEGKGWKGWKDWLGSEKLPFPEAKEIVHSFGLGGKEEYRRYIKENRPDGIPANPRRTYEGKGWKGWGDFLGTETRAPRETGWNIQKVKELLRDLIESKVIDTFSEVRLHNLLYSKGVLNLEKNRHTDFFKNLIKAARTEEGKKAITDYAYSGKENPPDLSDGVVGEEGEIQTVNSEELAKYIDGSDPLDHGKINTPEQILKQTEFLESICVDEEKMQFQVTCSVQDFWKSAFVNEIDTVNKVRSERLNGKEFHDTIVETFLSEYDGKVLRYQKFS
jgi:hypothetical protein